MRHWSVLLLMLFTACSNKGEPAGQPLTPRRVAPATGPLRVLASNPRYFTDGSGRAVYLTGAHTWSNFQDNGSMDPPPEFDNDAWLDSVVAHNHNFFRLWEWEQARWTAETADDNYWIAPLPWLRTGPGLAIDGKPRFDLSKFNPAYFERLHARAAAAGKRGIYVAVMLFDGWSIETKGPNNLNNPWRGHPFNRDNNINGIDGHLDPLPSGRATHTLLLPEVLAVQERYVRQVIDAVGDLDNVLYEISNESEPGSYAWQYHMIEFIKRYEKTKPKQHPVGMTDAYRGQDNAPLFASPADWISPSDLGGYDVNPTPGDGRKVVISDTDHLTRSNINQNWVWETFLRGLNPSLMDAYDGKATGLGAVGFNIHDPEYVRMRASMGYTLTYANRVNLAAMRPDGEIVSTRLCLANPGPSRPEYLIYLPAGGKVRVDLSDTPGSLASEWFSPVLNRVVPGDPVTGGAEVILTTPFKGATLLYLHRDEP